MKKETVILFHTITNYKRSTYSDELPYLFTARVGIINKDRELRWISRSYDDMDRESDYYDNLSLECEVSRSSFSGEAYIGSPELVYGHSTTIGRQRANRMAKTMNRIWKQIERHTLETGMDDFAALTIALKKAAKATRILTPRKGKEGNSQLHLPDYEEIQAGRIRGTIEMAFEREEEKQKEAA